MKRDRNSLIGAAIAAIAAFGFMALAAGETFAKDPACKQDKDMPSAYIFYFDVDSTALSQEDQVRLKEISNRAKNRILVCVIGQADKQGNEDYNKKLALKRAQVVADFMMREGVPKRVLSVRKILGEAFNDTTWLDWLPAHKKDRQVHVVFAR